jgi:hypothetical protein
MTTATCRGCVADVHTDHAQRDTEPVATTQQ